MYVHDVYGQLVAEYNSAGMTPVCTTCYLTCDLIGSVRMITDQNANVVARHDYVPYGEEIFSGVGGRSGNGFGNGANVAQMFTGQERDGGTLDLDYFNARQMSAVLGRFTQVDPGGAGADLMNPQTWSGYAYVGGNPLGMANPSEMDCIILDSGQTADDGQGQTCPGSTDPEMVNVYSGGPTAVAVGFVGRQGGFNGYPGYTGGGGGGSPQPAPVAPAPTPAPAPTQLAPIAPNSGLTKQQAACAADAVINGALSIFVPGYAATKALASFGGFSFNPVGALTGTNGLVSAGNPTLLQTAGGLAGANEIYQDSRFAAAGGASALARVQNLKSRVGFGAQTASRQGRLLSQLGNLESLEGAASFASKANNVTAAISAGYDIYKCVTTP